MPDFLETPSMIGTLCGVVAALIASVVILRNLSGRKDSKMGINLASGQKCLHCGANLPAVRKPKNFRQMMWGGWTCENCDKECDKWARSLDERN
jgi:hypothetical protein